MTRAITMYQCEICSNYFDAEAKAISCEERGKELPLASVGDFVEYEIKVGGGFDSFYVDLRISEVEDTGHYLIYHFDQEHGQWNGSPYSEYGNDSFSERTRPKQAESDDANG